MFHHRSQCIIWGATGQAKVAYEILSEEGVRVIHLFDNNSTVVSPIPGIPVSYGRDGISSFVDSLKRDNFLPEEIDCVSAIGGSRGAAREITTHLMECFGFKSRSLIHQKAVISSLANIGNSVQLLAGSVVGPYASIGDFSIINSGANVDHDCIIGKGCHLAPRAALAGEITVQDHVFIGTNATVLPRICIGSGAVIGAGAVVTKDVAPGVTVVGNPARPLVK